MQGRKNYQEKLFASFQLSERIPEDNFYRRLKEILDLQWLYKVTKKYYGHEGQQSIDPTVFFKLILIGYLENLSSDRRIINTASMRMDILYFIGYDIDEALPWHSTLSRTRQLYNQDVFKELFKEVLKQCIDKGMVSGRRQAIDSVLVKANASLKSVIEKEVLEDAELYIDHLEEKSTEQSHAKAKKNYHNPFDPDARLATKPGKPTQLYYLAQVSVDSSSHVITNIDACHADKRDSECLEDMVEQTKENLQSNGLLMEEVLADTNYSSGTALQYLEDVNIVGYIPNLGAYKKDRDGFTYDDQRDEYKCTQGVSLTFRGIAKSNKAGRYKRAYSSTKKDCADCELRSQCIGSAGIKRLTITQDKPLFDRMHARFQTAKGKGMKKIRSATVEPVLGTLVNFLGMRRVNTKGIQQASKCVIMAALCYNLKKLLKFKVPKMEIVAKLVEVCKEKGSNYLSFSLFPSQ